MPAVVKLNPESVLYDANGNPIGVELDGLIYRLQTESKSRTHDKDGTGITSIADTEEPGDQRLQTEARLAPGSIVNIGTAIPSNVAALKVSFLTNGGSENMLIDGTTPVVFSYAPTSGTVALQELLLVFTADDFSFDGLSFGPNPKLTNGILVETVINSVVTPIFNIRQNEDFLRVPGRLPLVNNTGPKDVLGVSFSFGGLVKLNFADSDLIRITVRDDLTSVKLKYLTATIYGVEL